MMAQDLFGDGYQFMGRINDTITDFRMFLDFQPFFSRELAGFVQYFVSYAYFPDVMQPG